ncbi:MAG: hypothetical protein F2825_09985 [Actinobacteria bacterium]|uniref:Unannotated protein n=1 Tax=freshwater metagenome TaxID=449393 RepID=A0A6J7IHS3_9ZZZZ|nr:hypothetical protein [Actinomycetota bacterium]
MSSSWECADHGPVSALWSAVARPTGEAVRQLAGAPEGGVPLWSPLPLPGGWTLGGLGTATDPRTGVARATATAFGGPSPLGGPADLVVVAEEPGTGLGARVAGRPDVEPGDCAVGPPEAKVVAAGHLTALWRCDSADDRVAFVGEALGVWLWAVLWPPAAELVLLEHVELHDLRHDAHAQLDLPIGAPSPRLP